MSKSPRVDDLHLIHGGYVALFDLARSIECSLTFTTRQLEVAVRALKKEIKECGCLYHGNGNHQLGIPPCDRCGRLRSALKRIAEMKEGEMSNQIDTTTVKQMIDGWESNTNPLPVKELLLRICQERDAALKRAEEADTVLGAWQRIFGTTQLSHASARLEAAEEKVERLQYDLAAANRERDAAIKRAEEAEKQLAYLADQHKRIVNEPCPTDEKHCTCVPILKGEIEQLRDRLATALKRAEEAEASLAEHLSCQSEIALSHSDICHKLTAGILKRRELRGPVAENIITILEDTERQLAAANRERERIEREYHELIMAVGRKYPGETRHQTALRYIGEAENMCSGPCKTALAGEGKSGGIIERREGE